MSRTNTDSQLEILRDGLFFNESEDQPDGYPHFRGEEVMPYDSKQEPLGKGASAIAYKIKIVEGHFEMGTMAKTRNTEVRLSLCYDDIIA